MRAFAVWLNRLLWLTLVVSVLGLGAIVALGRHYAPLLERHTDDVIALVNERTGLHLRADALRAEWRLFAPRFELRGVDLLDPTSGEPVAGLEHLRFRLDVVASLAQMTPVLSAISGDGLFAVLEETALGQWRLRGLDSREGGGGGQVAELLLAVRSAQIDDSRLELRFFNGGRTELRGALRFERAGSFRRLLLAMATASDGAPVELTVEARGDPRDRARFQATGYAQFNGVDLSPILPLARRLGVELRHGRIDGRAWLTWAPGGRFSARGELGVPTLDLAALIDREVAPVTGIRAEFVLEEGGGERQLWLPSITATWGEQTLRFERLWLGQDGETPHQLKLALAHLDLGETAALLGAEGVLPPLWRKALAGLAPTGTLHDLVATVPLGRAHAEQFSLRAHLREVEVQPWRAAPGIRGGTGYGEIDLGGGRVWLRTPELALDFPTIYAAPIVLADAHGRVNWSLADGRARVISNTLDARLGDSRARAHFALDLPFQANAAVPPQMTLSVGLEDGSPAVAAQLIPTTLSAELRAWLKQAELTGGVPRAGFIYRGSLRAGDHLARTVQLFLDIDSGALSFHEAWPLLHGIDGEFWLDDAAVVARADEARLYDGLALSSVAVALTPAARGSELTVAAIAAGAGDDWLRLLRETPLDEATAGLADRLRWAGPATATVQLAVPLGSPGKLAVDLRGELQGGTLGLTRPALAVEALTGRFSYRQGRALSSEPPPSGLTADNLTGLLHDRPVRASIATVADGTVTARLDTTVAVNDWRHLLPVDMPWLRGATRAEGKVRWREGRGELTLDSNLVGLTIDLPAPYQKPPELQLPLALWVESAAPAARTLDARTLNAQARGSRRAELRKVTRTRVEGELGDWLGVALDWGGERLRRGRLRFGPEDAANAPARFGTLVVTGSLPAIDYEAWRAPLETLRMPSASEVAAEGDDAARPRPLPVVVAGLRAPAVTVAGNRFDAVRLDGTRLADRWHLRATSTQATGELTLPLAPDAVPRLHLAELRLPPLAAGEGDRGDALARIDPARAPALDLEIDELWLGDERWGSLGFAMRPQPNGVALHELRGELRGLRLAPRPDEPAHLVWTRTAGVDRTTLDVRLGVTDVGRVLERWGFERAIVSRRGHLDLAVAWEASPALFDIAALSGAAALNLEEGRFLRAPSGTTGALKVVGIFNLANLVRRLRLDFTDFFSDGIAFDEIDGSFTLQQGVLTTVRAIDVTSPSSRFRLGGLLDINTASIDMELVVTLPLASNLPWVAALAGGLPAAAGVYIASKLFGEKVDRYSSAVYEVEGSWQDPTIRFRRIFGEEPQPTRGESALPPVDVAPEKSR